MICIERTPFWQNFVALLSVKHIITEELEGRISDVGQIAELPVIE